MAHADVSCMKTKINKFKKLGVVCKLNYCKMKNEL